MSGPDDDTDEQIGEDLLSAYRAAIEDPPYGATDRTLLRAAACRDTFHWPRATVYAALALLVAALGLVTLPAISPRIDRGGNIGRQGMANTAFPTARTTSNFISAPLEAALRTMKAGNYQPGNRKLQRAQTGRRQKTYDEYLTNAALGTRYARENQLEQAAVALQFAAESQYAALAMQVEATDPDLYAARLDLVRVQPIPSSVR